MSGNNRGAVVDQAVSVLRAGRTVALSTDTVWGIAVDPHNLEAVERLYEQKHRPADKALQVLCADAVTAERFVALDEELRGSWERVTALWPGALTLVVPAVVTCPEWLTRDGKVGLRIPASVETRELLAAFGGALAASSLNRSGEAPARSFDEALSLGIADFVLPGGATGGEASTVFDLVEGRVLRVGGVSEDRLRSLS